MNLKTAQIGKEYIIKTIDTRDAELDAFSAAVDSNPFNRDKSKYPATPTTKLPARELPWEDPAILAAKP